MNINKPTLFLSIFAAYSALSVTYAEEMTKDNVTEEDAVLHLNDMTVTQSAGDANISHQTTLGKDDIAKKQSQISDTAQLLGDTAGVSFQGAGGVSSIPILRGLNDTRGQIPPAKPEA
jgi:iron complex outermembrane receptor protein